MKNNQSKKTANTQFFVGMLIITLVFLLLFIGVFGLMSNPGQNSIFCGYHLTGVK